MSTIGFLELERRRQGLTGTQLARKMGVSRGQLSEVERGHRRPSHTFKIWAATALGVRSEQLFPEWHFLVRRTLERDLHVLTCRGLPLVFTSEELAQPALGQIESKGVSIPFAAL